MKRTKPALRKRKTENQKDLAVFSERAKEPTVSYEDMLKKLKIDGKI